MKTRKEFRKGDRIFSFLYGNGYVETVKTSNDSISIGVVFDSGSRCIYNSLVRDEMFFHGTREEALQLLEQLRPKEAQGYWLTVVKTPNGICSPVRHDDETQAHRYANGFKAQMNKVFEVFGPYYCEELPTEEA